MATQDHGHRRAASRPIRHVYRRLLRLLPFEFRSEFGRDIEQAFADEHDEVRARRSAAATLRFWLRTAWDLARVTPRQHWDLLRQDVEVGVRTLARNPAFTATAVLTLALGIGGSTSIFAVVYAVVLRPLAFPGSERIVRVGWAGEGAPAAGELSPSSYSDLLAIRQQGRAFDLVGAIRSDLLSSEQGSLNVLRPGSAGVGGVGQSFVIPQMASASIFAMFHASAALGRLPDERDEQPAAAPVAVLSYATWSSRYGRDPSVIGRTLVRDVGDGRRTVVTIVGVLAPGAFAGSAYYDDTPAWSSFDAAAAGARDRRGREIYDLSLYARLAPAAHLDTARAEVGGLTPHLASGLADSVAARKPALLAMLLRDHTVARVRAPLLAFLAAVTCLLLVTAANVAGLVLARSLSRRQEFAARFALGARPLRVARQLLTESGILAVAGGALGTALAWAGVGAFRAISPAMPRLEQSDIGVPALAFALAAVALVTIAAGVMPAFQASRRSVVDGLRRVGGAPATSTPFSTPLAWLAGAEVALVLALLAGAGLLVNSFARLTLFDIGFDARSVIMTTIERGRPAASAEHQRQVRAIDAELIERVSAISGVSAAGLTGDDPFGPPYRYRADIRIGDSVVASPAIRIASPNALQALGMRVTAGRWFSAADTEGVPLVAVVNEEMARRFWGGSNPIGERIVYGARVLHVVGIAADVRAGPRADVSPTFYVSTSQMPPEPVMLVVRRQHGVPMVESAIAAELARMGPRIKATAPRQLEDIWWRRLSSDRFLTLVVSAFSLLSLVVALVGVHGTMRFLVAQRARELGIRTALGARPVDTTALVLRQALRFTVPGCIVGLAAAALATPALRSQLFGVTPADPLTLAAATALLLAAVGAGAYLPARRAGAIDPALSLRPE